MFLVVLLVILAILLVILFTPFGAALRYEGGTFSVALRVLCFQIGLLPKKEKPEKERKPRKKREKKPGKEKKPKAPEDGGAKPKKKLPVGLSDLPQLLRLLLDTLSRFRRKLTVNEFMLHLVVAGDDPYDTVVLYGAVNTLLGMLSAKQGSAFRVVRSDVQTAVDFTADELQVEAALTVTISLGRILAVVLAMAWGFLRILRSKKKELARAQGAKERMDRDGTDPDVGIPASQHS